MRAKWEILVLALALCIGGCSRENSVHESKALAHEGQILVVLKSLNNPFFLDIQKGFEDEWKKIGGDIPVYVKAGNNEGDVSTQRTILDGQFGQFVAGRAQPQIKGIVLTPSSSGADLVPQIKNFRDSGVPLILLDTAINPEELKRSGTDYNLFVHSDNREGGRLAAKTLGEALKLKGQKCRLLILNGEAGQETAIERREGFIEEAPKYSCTIALEKTANWQRSEAHHIVSQLSGHWNYTGIFAANDEMALGAFAALQQSNIVKEIPIVGFDATDEARQAVNNKQLYATIAQDPVEMGRRAAQALAKYANGQSPQKFIVEALPPKVVTR